MFVFFFGGDVFAAFFSIVMFCFRYRPRTHMQAARHIGVK